jgi:hypothetical protein
MAPSFRVLNVLNYVPRIEELAARKQRDKLEILRVRQSGALGLHSA